MGNQCLKFFGGPYRPPEHISAHTPAAATDVKQTDQYSQVQTDSDHLQLYLSSDYLDSEITDEDLLALQADGAL
jgi:hypothetical protein